MASRTQLRLGQITGSFGDVEGKIVDNLPVAATLGAIPEGSGSMVTVMSQFASAIQRVHGGTAFTTNAAGVFSHTIKPNSAGGQDIGAADAEWGDIYIGDKEIKIGLGQEHFIKDANTGLQIGSSEIIKIGADANTSNIEIGNIGQAKTITIGHDTSTKVDVNAAAIELDAGANGVVINAAGVLDVDATGKINIATSNANGDALTIDVSGNGGADITIGNAANDANANLDIVVMNKLNIDVQGTDAADGVEITLGGDNADAKVIIQNNSGNDALTVDGLLDVSVGRNLTVAGNLDVNGTTTTIDTTNLTVEDSIIALGVSGSGTYSTTGDRGILFPRGAVGSATKGFWYDGTQFNLAETKTGPTSGSFQSVDSYSPLLLGDTTLKNNGSVLTLGTANTFVLTHANSANTAIISSNDRLAFGDAGEYIVGDGTDLSIASSNNISLNADGQNIILEDGAKTFGILKSANSGRRLVVSSSNKGIALDHNTSHIKIQTEGTEVGRIVADNDGGAGLILSSSLNKTLTLDSNQGFIQMTQGTADGGSNGAAFVLGGNSIQIEKLSYDPGEGGTAFKFVHNDTFGSQFLQVSGSLRLHKSNGGANYVAIDVDNPTSDYTLTLPDAVPSTANEILISDTSGNLSFATQAELGLGAGSISKGVKILSSGVSAGTEVNFNAVTAGDTISGLTQASSLGASVDLYVNGQLLVSGSGTEIGVNPTRDYEIQSSGTTVKFAFDLEADDVIQLIKR